MKIKHPQFKSDWEQFISMPFRWRKDRVGPSFIRVYRLIDTATDHPDYDKLWQMKDLLLLSHSFWRVPLHGMAERMCKIIRSGKRLDDQFLFLFEMMQLFPSVEERNMILRVERMVEKGCYDLLVGAQAKYAAQLKILMNNPAFRGQWKRFRQLFDVEKFKDRYSILRRSLSRERNFPPDPWKFTWDDEEGCFQMAFDIFCGNWILFGMELRPEGDMPLLQKLTINPTHMGWIIFIPAYLSIDGRRDFMWPEFNENQAARGVQKQGPKLSEARIERTEECAEAYAASLEADELEKTGGAKIEHVIKHLGLAPETDHSFVRRLIKDGRNMAEEIGIVLDPLRRATLADESDINFINADKTDLEYAWSAFSNLTPEKKEEFLKRLKM